MALDPKDLEHIEAWHRASVANWSPMALDPKDLEHIERLLYKHNDDLAVAIARSFERLEERMDAIESRLYARITELEDKLEASRQDLSDKLGEVRDELKSEAF